jgi:hypothetical protein
MNYHTDREALLLIESLQDAPDTTDASFNMLLRVWLHIYDRCVEDLNQER